MNINYLRNILFGVCLMFSPLASSANEISIAGKSAQEAFHDDRVVKLLQDLVDGDISGAKSLIAAGANLNAIGEDGVTPIIWMLGAHDIKAMKILLDLGADPNKYILQNPGIPGFPPPIWLAAGGGKIEMLQLLLDHGADSNLTMGGKSPLMLAISGSHLECAELLLHYGADINYSSGPMSAFFETIIQAQFDNTIWVLNHGYRHDLPTAQRMIAGTNPRPGQEAMKIQALETVKRLLVAPQ